MPSSSGKLWRRHHCTATNPAILIPTLIPDCRERSHSSMPRPLSPATWITPRRTIRSPLIPLPSSIFVLFIISVEPSRIHVFQSYDPELGANGIIGYLLNWGFPKLKKQKITNLQISFLLLLIILKRVIKALEEERGWKVKHSLSGPVV